MTTKQRCTTVTASLAVMLLCLGTAGAATEALMIPAAAFSADGTGADDYINHGNRLYTLNSTNLYFHAWVKLPNLATITNVDMMTRDDATGTITGYLKRTKFGSDSGTETLLTFTSPGNIGCSASGLCHDMESLLEIQVDTANYAYWFDVYVPYAPGHTPLADYLEFYAVRILYEHDDLIFGDTLESGNTIMWSNGTTSKSGVVAGGSAAGNGPAVPSELTDEDRLASSLSRLYIEDPLAQEALELAIAGKAGYASPYIIPATAFKTQAYIHYDDYYFSEGWGVVYGRPSGGDSAYMTAPVYLPHGAEILYYFAYFVDSVRIGETDNIRFWMNRMDATDIIPDDTMVYEVSSGRSTAIQTKTVSAATMEAAAPGSTTIDNSKYTYWLTVELGPYDLSPPPPDEDEEWWHKVYAIVFLYTMPD